VRQLNGMSLGTLSEFVEHGRLKEFPGDYPNDLKMISNLLSDTLPKYDLTRGSVMIF
jgi:starvation-inducible DNA-binding protein